MTTNMNPRRHQPLMVAALALLAGGAVQAQPTPISEIVMYGVDTDTDALYRYNFDTDEFKAVGYLPSGAHAEAMCYLPGGPHRGFYVMPAAGPRADWIMKMNAFDAALSPFMDLNVHITGGTGYYDAALDQWLMLWVEHDSDYLLTVNPGTGEVKTIVPSVANFEGLALGYDGRTLYGVTTTRLYRVDLVTRVQTLIGNMPGADKCESLGFAFGDFGPAVTVPGVPAAWTQNGLLVGFDDDNNGLMIINPANAQVIRYASSIVATDIEGIDFVTKSTDPLGRIMVEAFD